MSKLTRNPPVSCSGPSEPGTVMEHVRGRVAQSSSRGAPCTVVHINHLADLHCSMSTRRPCVPWGLLPWKHCRAPPRVRPGAHIQGGPLACGEAALVCDGSCCSVGARWSLLVAPSPRAAARPQSRWQVVVSSVTFTLGSRWSPYVSPTTVTSLESL